ncbi:MAG TPA: hypothetical protein VGF52_02575 [Tepidisphaeraceae bacterium]
MLKPLVFCMIFLIVGCAQTRTVTISAMPGDAELRIDGVDRGRGPITQQFSFNSDSDSHRIIASRLGYKDAFLTITRDLDSNELSIEMKPETRRIHIMVEPAPAIISVDGKPLSADPVSVISTDVELGVDAKNNPIVRTITAEHTNMQTAVRKISRNDTDASYVLKLGPLTKNLNVTTKPPGADILIDHEKIGVSPLTGVPVEFPVDLDTNEFLPHRLTAQKAGYDPVEFDITWDNGKTDYPIDLAAKSKLVRFITDPPGATVKVDGNELPRDGAGMSIAKLQFPPASVSGDMIQYKIYTVLVSKKTADSEWQPTTSSIGWDNGQNDYHVTLKEILTRPVQLLTATMHRSDDGWEIQPAWINTIAMKDVTEGPTKPSPQQVTRLAKGTQLDSLTLSPDGTQIIFTILAAGQNRNDFHSQMWVIKTDGTGGADIVSDGKSLDIMPNFSPGGDQIVFSSNRSGKRLTVWSMAANGVGGITRLTSGDTNDLWPTIDSDPKPRLFYQAMVDTRPDPRIYMTQIGTIFQTDLTMLGGMQPRVSPKNDAILFCAANEKTGKRDIYIVSDKGGVPQNLTNAADDDDFDANWSKDGSKIVYTSDHGASPDGRRNYDIWMIDLANPQQPIQLTTNASHDDCPVFDVTGANVFFRSNRGGQWGIWRIAVK